MINLDVFWNSQKTSEDLEVTLSKFEARIEGFNCVMQEKEKLDTNDRSEVLRILKDMELPKIALV